MLDVLIRNGTIVDGTGSNRYQADVGINNAMITYIQKDLDVPAKHVIDAQGQIVSPGFIDIHSHSDLSPFLPITKCKANSIRALA